MSSDENTLLDTDDEICDSTSAELSSDHGDFSPDNSADGEFDPSTEVQSGSDFSDERLSCDNDNLNEEQLGTESEGNEEQIEHESDCASKNDGGTKENVTSSSKEEPSKSEKKPSKSESAEDENCSVDEVKTWIASNLLTPDLPPPEKRHTARAWTEEGGMRFLYWTEKKIVFPNWYYCVICDWLHRCVLGRGTNAIKSHAEKHVYQFSKSELAAILQKATAFGDAHGALSERVFRDNLPSFEKWYLTR